jgi:hypothetical protein
MKALKSKNKISQKKNKKERMMKRGPKTRPKRWFANLKSSKRLVIT